MPLFDTKKVSLGEDWVEIRELSVPALKEADRRGTEDAVALMGMLPDKIVEDQLAKARDMAVERIIRYEGYDPETLLKYGIVGWSFPEPCDEEHKTQLGAKNGEIVARAVFELSVLPSGEVSNSSPKSAGDESPHVLPEPVDSTRLVEA